MFGINRIREITVVPYGGLCNRLNVLVAAHALSEKYHSSRIKIFWDKKAWCGSAFSSLFTPPYMVNSDKISIIDVNSIPPLWQRSLPRNLYMAGYIRKGLGIVNLENYYPPSIQKNAPTIDFRVNERKRVYISSCVRFLPAVTDIRELFVPRPRLANAVERVSDCFNRYTIGVHIRRGDHQKSIEASPLELFIRRMDQHVEEQKDTQFFLATDCLQTKKELVSRYGNRIISHDIELSRSSEKGMEGAVIDLFCLSKTQLLLGSAYSSFSEMASEIGQIPLEMVIR